MILSNNLFKEYKSQLAKGQIQQAYRGIMDFMLALKAQLKTKYPAYTISGSLYQGYMDMTYFACTPPALQARGLKVALVFIHPGCRFEAWLGGANKAIQKEYWQKFKAGGWTKHPLLADLAGEDAFTLCVLESDPDFDQPDALSAHLEQGLLAFIRDAESFLASLKD